MNSCLSRCRGTDACMLQEEDRATMYACLRTIFERAPAFGGGLFSLAASVMTDLTHHDPLSFPGLDEAGLPAAFINAIKVTALNALLWPCLLETCRKHSDACCSCSALVKEGRRMPFVG